MKFQYGSLYGLFVFVRINATIDIYKNQIPDLVTSDFSRPVFPGQYQGLVRADWKQKRENQNFNRGKTVA